MDLSALQESQQLWLDCKVEIANFVQKEGASFRGPDYASVDVSLFKNIPIKEDVKLQFRAEAFNLFNCVNLFLPNNVLNNPTFFGKSTAAFDPRQLQFALKLIF